MAGQFCFWGYDVWAIDAGVGEDARGWFCRWDHGTGLAEHTKLAISAEIPVYFAHPHSPWERATNDAKHPTD